MVSCNYIKYATSSLYVKYQRVGPRHATVAGQSISAANRRTSSISNAISNSYDLRA